MKFRFDLLCGALVFAGLVSIAVQGCTPVEPTPPGATVPPSVTIANPVWPADVPVPDEEDTAERDEASSPVTAEPPETRVEEPVQMTEPEGPVDKPAVDVTVDEPAKPAMGELVEIDLELPAPAFRGTPVPVDEPNVEKPRGGPRQAFLAPEGTVNLALAMPVSASDPAPVAGELDYVTNGDKEASDFGYLELAPGTQWVQIDLGQRGTIYAVLLWHNHAEARVYRDVVVQISDCPDFLESHTVFNNDYDNSSGLGIGPDMGYVETSEGKLIDAKGLEGRYVRLYSRGNHIDGKNHYTEVAVYGVPLESNE